MKRNKQLFMSLRRQHKITAKRNVMAIILMDFIDNKTMKKIIHTKCDYFALNYLTVTKYTSSFFNFLKYSQSEVSVIINPLCKLTE